MNPLNWSFPDILMLKSFGQQLAEFNQPYTAKNIFNQLVQRVKDFESTLDQEHEVGMRLVSFGKSTEFSVSSIGYLDPCLVWFQGVLADGTNVELVQHVSQINFMLLKLKRQTPDLPRCPIGFCAEGSAASSKEDNPPTEIIEAEPKEVK